MLEVLLGSWLAASATHSGAAAEPVPLSGIECACRLGLQRAAPGHQLILGDAGEGSAAQLMLDGVGLSDQLDPLAPDNGLLLQCQGETAGRPISILRHAGSPDWPRLRGRDLP